MQFTKLFSSILDSTIWQESPQTKLVWITLLAMVDKSGEVHASIPGLAKRAGVSLEECENALKCLLSPDKYSRTPDHEGRRIENIDGGWGLLNHNKYRKLLSHEERKEYNRRKQAEYREKKRKAMSMTVNDKSITVIDSEQNAHSTDADADTEVRVSEAKASSCSSSPKISDSDVLEIYAAYPMKKAKASAIKAISKALKITDKKTILEALPRYVADCQSRDVPFAYPATWFNAQRWEDEYSEPKKLNSATCL